MCVNVEVHLFHINSVVSSVIFRWGIHYFRKKKCVPIPSVLALNFVPTGAHFERFQCFQDHHFEQYPLRVNLKTPGLNQAIKDLKPMIAFSISHQYFET